MPKDQNGVRPADEVRRIILRYFYDRNCNATSSRGKKGSAVMIKAIKSELKSQHELSQKEVQSNLTYLLSQGWVGELLEQKQFRTDKGTLQPSTARFHQITASGIDKIEGEGEFTMPKFSGIKIEATGQNIITLGDGNKINAQFSDLGKALVQLREAITASQISEAAKLNLVADIDTVQSQLAKPHPNQSIIAAAWLAVKASATINGCATLVDKVGGLIAGFLT